MAKTKTAKRKPRTRVKHVSPITKKVKGSVTKKVSCNSEKPTAKKHKNTNKTVSQVIGEEKTTPKKIVRSKKKTAKDGTQRGMILSEGLQANKWKPGQSGNPKGKPPGTIGLISYLRKHLQETIKNGKKKGKKRGEYLMEQMVRLAGTAYGAQQLRQLLDRVEGPVPTKIEGGEEPIRMAFNFVKAVAPEATLPPADAELEATT